MATVKRVLSRASYLTIILAIALSQQSAQAQNKASQIDALLNKYHELGQFNGSVLVAERGKVIYKKGFGYANLEWKIPNTPDTKFRIGSVTKQFTAVLILQLVEERKLSLDGKITDYLADYPKETGERVTIHHLLTHTSGIPSYTGLPDFMDEHSRDPAEPQEFISTFSELDLEFEPGSEFRYNNSGYFLLGVIIEAVTGRPYAEVLRERILEPLGLDDTGYDDYRTVLDNKAAGYRRTFAGYVRAPYLDMSLPYSAGSMYSTVQDLYKWDRVLYTDVLFHDPKYKELMFTPNLQDYGYGWRIWDAPVGANGTKVKVIEHGGGIHGFSTRFRRLVDDGSTIVLTDNTEGRKVGEINQGITNILYGEPAEEPVQSIAQVLAKTIDAEGVSAGIEQYRQLKRDQPDAYDFRERELNNLGYQYLGERDYETAIAVFKLNVEVYPDAFNTYDSLGEAYMKAGNRELAIANYQKSLELNPRNENGKQMLAELGVEVDPDLGKEITLAPAILARYVGKYELRPGFELTITQEGEVLMAQATGQPKAQIFAESETDFFLKVAPIRLTFNMNGAGEVESLTLHQGGQHMPAKKIE